MILKHRRKEATLYLFPNAHFKKDRSLKFKIRPTDGISVKKPKQTLSNKTKDFRTPTLREMSTEFQKGKKSWIEPL